MGCYDTVNVFCPGCGRSHDFQSKGGACQLKEYTLSDAPARIKADLDGDERTCECGMTFTIQTQAIAVATPVRRK